MQASEPQHETGVMTELEAKFEDRSAVVAVMGLGYVGLPLLHAFWDNPNTLAWTQLLNR